ncbi:MAG TPA: bifunctional hydroxymethylpyrimidine kinase/phosphomethylpyrimidine kinase, partial [Nannocystaceae bacterium]|nr:bifunctional hydroxymethylpyrimidine kinase/phosphomethylpyrimidine kinase [Nannocystaceae bacterium]
MKLWVIGGLDPTGGAGVLRDRWTAEGLVPGVDVTTVITAYTQQGDGLPARAHAVAEGELTVALQRIDEADAIKIGLVPAACVDAVLAAIERARAPSVLDPVMRASDGGDLGATAQTLRPLARAVGLVTPNRAEALALGEPLALAPTLYKNVDASPGLVCDRLLV